MKSLKEKIKELSVLQFYFLISVIGFLPILIFGYFIQDDYGIKNFYYLNFSDATEWMCTVNNNRPLSCIYFAALTRVWPVYQIYFLLIFFIFSLFIFKLINVYDFIIKDKITKKLFILFLIFPFFSYTILYSPAMQGIGAFSLLIWVYSLFFLKKFITYNKKIFFILSHFLILIMYLTYESSAPLLGLSLIFPLFFSKKKLFFLNALFIGLITFLILYLQKKVFPEIFDIDLSRVKLSIINLKQLLYLILINISLTINIFFYSIEIFINNLFYNIKNFNFLLILQIISLVTLFYISINKLDTIIKKNYNKKNNLLIFLSIVAVVFLNVLMHSLANTGIDFIQYNNRALTSISSILPFIILLLILIIKSRNINILKNLIVFFYLVLLSNFLYFQNNLISEKFLAQKIIRGKNEILGEQSYKKNTRINFVFYDNHNLSELMSYNSLDAITSLNKSSSEIYININTPKFCNKAYYNEYIKKAYLDNNYDFTFIRYAFRNINSKKQINFKKKMNNISRPDIEVFNNLENYEVVDIFNQLFECSNYTKYSEMLKRDVYLDNRYEGLFLESLKKIYFKLF